MRSTYSLKTPSIVRQPLLVIVLALSILACGEQTENTTQLLDSHTNPNVAPVLTHPVTVSGVSAGAYMAVQTHVALSDRVAGVGVIAGGPYHCAAGSVSNALGRCLSGEELDTVSLTAFTRDKSAVGEIANVSNMQDAKVWIFRSPRDVVVQKQVAVSLVEFYENFVTAENIRMVDDVETAHGWPTLDQGSECLVIGGDFINACGFDSAGEMLNHFYDDLAPRNTKVDDGAFKTIDISHYFNTGSGVADTGYIYVPENCDEPASDCRLHISFHGCRQGAEFIDNRFALHAGLNEWAAQNQIVVIYPQIKASFTNPQGCWDWWGYTGAQYDQKNGKQISGINAIITAFAMRQLTH